MKTPAANQSAHENSYPLRIFLLLSVIIIFLGLVGVRLFFLQVVNHSHYAALVASQQDSLPQASPNRGEIYLEPATPDSQPVLVATNVQQSLLRVNQKLITDPDGEAAQLAPLLQMNRGDIAPKLKGTQSYVVIKKQLSDDAVAQINALKLPGVFLEPDEERLYPEGTLASQVLGFLGFSGDKRVGQYGVEGGFEKQLAGQTSADNSSSDSASADSLANEFLPPSLDGDNIYLTIDPAIQFKAQEVLKQTISDHSADAGSVVVVNPKTGAILAMATEPDFDPNNYSQVPDISVYNNQAIASDYEPGSVFKAITLAAAADSGKITPETTFNNTGSVQVDDKVIKNSSPTEFLGNQSMITVLDESLNTGAVWAQQQMGNDLFKKYVQDFGFGQTIDLGLPGETGGNLSNLNQKGNIFFATASFGQGISVTPIQLVRAYTALANGGVMIQPYLVDKVVYPDGTEDVTHPDTGKQIISPQTASTLSAMLVDVVENGHGKKAAVPGYYIAGKTGTAQVALPGGAGYDPNKNIGSFIGYGPVDDPKFLMIVRVDNPKDVKFAETTAAPAFGQIAQFILNYLQVPPSR